MKRVSTTPESRDAVDCERCKAVRHMAVRGERIEDGRIATTDCCWLCGGAVDQLKLDGAVDPSTYSAIQAAEKQRDEAQSSRNLKATAQNVLSAWDNPSPGPEKWDRVRQKMEYLREAVADRG